MSNTTTSSNRVSDLFSLVRKHWLMLVIPLALCTLAAAWFAFQPKMWQASQSLAVRDDLIGESFKPGRFDSLDSMKTAQETILHIATDFGVVRNALEKVGPVRGNRENWLEGKSGVKKVEDLRERISLVAPNGAEFGKTEVIILQVKSSSSDRSAKLVTALLDEIEAKLRNLRSQRLHSMEAELGQALELAEKDYLNFSAEMREMENEVGSDLPTLLSMINDGHSTNDIKVALENLRIAERSAEDDYQETVALVSALEATMQNPEALVATSDQLLEKQPALKRLKDGLVDSQLELSGLRGQYQEVHPEVIKARYAVEETESQIRRELSLSMNGLQDQEDILKNRVNRLVQEQAELEERLAKLTKNRVGYATLSSQSKKRNDELAAARNRFGEIKSLGAAAATVNLVSRLDKEPHVDGEPLGPGKTSILGSGMLGGLLIGLGLITFFAGPSLPVVQGPSDPNAGPSNLDQGTIATNQPSQYRDSQTGSESNSSVAESSSVQQEAATSNPLPVPAAVSTLAETNTVPVSSASPVVKTPVEPAADRFVDQQTDSFFGGSGFSQELDETLEPEKFVVENQPENQPDTSTQSEPFGSAPIVPTQAAPLRPVQAVRNLESNQPPAHEAVSEDIAPVVASVDSDSSQLTEDAINSSFENLDVAGRAEEKTNNMVEDIEEQYSRSFSDLKAQSAGRSDTAPTTDTIDLNTLRAELGASPIATESSPTESSSSKPANATFDMKDIQQSTSEESNPDAVDEPVMGPLDTLQEKIRKLTDPSRLNLNQGNAKGS